jgi:hypothetical protein
LPSPLGSAAGEGAWAQDPRIAPYPSGGLNLAFRRPGQGVLSKAVREAMTVAKFLN